MKPRKRWFAALALVLMLVAALFAATSETAFRTGAQLVARGIPGLELSGVSGRLSHGARIERIRWQGESATVVVTQLATEWRVWPALVGRVHLDSLRADEVSVELHGRDTGAGRAGDRPGPALPADIELPVLMRVDELAIGRVSVERAGERWFTLAGIEGDALRADRDGFSVATMAANGTPVSATVTGTLDPSGDWPLDLAVDYRLEFPGRPVLSGSLSARGALAGVMATTLQVNGAGSASWAGDVSGVFGAPRVAGRLVVRDAPLTPWIPPSRFSDTRVSAVLRLDGWPGTLGVDGSVAAAHPDWPRLRAELAARWGRDLVVVHEVSIRSDDAPVTLRGGGRYDWSQALPTGAANLRWEHLQWPLLADETPWTSAAGTVSADLDAETLTTRGEAQFGADPDGRVTFEADLQLARGGRPFRGRTAVQWTDLVAYGVSSARGSASVRGAIDDWSGALAATASAGGLPALEFETAVTGGPGSVHATGFTGQWLQGGLAGAVEFDWTDGLRGTADLRMTGLDPGGIAADWPGRVSGRLNATVTPDDGRVRWSANLADLDGELRAMRFAADAELQGRDGALEAVDATVSVGDSHARVHGTASPALDLEWELAVADLGRLASRAGGNLDAKGTVRGNAGAPAIGFDVDGRELVLGDHAIGEFEANGLLDLRADGVSALHVRAGAVRVGARPVASAALDIEGPRDALEIAFGVQADGADLAVALSGAWRDAVFDGALTTADITLEGFAPWTLGNPVALTLGREAVAIERACWNQADTANDACIEGAWRAGIDADLSVTLVELPLERLSAWLPAGFGYEGLLSGDATLAWRAGEALEIAGRLAASPGSWRQVVRDEPVTLLNWREAAVEATFSRGTLAADLQFTLVDGGDLTAGFTLPVLDNEAGAADARPLRARLAGAYSNFDLLPAFVPDVGSVSGRVRTDLTVTGTRADPLFDGTLVIEDGTTTIPRLGLRLTGLELAIEGGRGSVGVRARARSGDGEMGFDGTFAIRDGDLAGNGTLRGADFTVSDIPEARVVVSPEVELKLDGHSIRVDGEVRVPFARIEPRDLAGVVPVSQDQVLVDTEGETRVDDGWRISARVRMSLGDVRFEGFGLTADITGALTAVDEPGVPTRANGELQIRNGRYAAWGQNLEIERGRLVFAGGPITDPGLDIRASRRPEADILVGADVRGTLREPELRLFSEPAMQQSELLSWLILGIPLAQSGGSEQALLDNTRDTAGLAGGEMVLSELGRRLGIGEVGIERGDTPDQAELVIGRYLSPRFYIAYGIGIFDPSNSVRVKYLIDRRWSIEAETGQDSTSTDLIYSIER